MRLPTQILDLSIPIESMRTPVYAGTPPPLMTKFSTIRESGVDAANVWIIGEHTGTHVDAPTHFIETAKSIDQVPLTAYVAQGKVLDFCNKKPNSIITKDDLDRQLTVSRAESKCILLFYTGYTAMAGTDRWMDYPSIDGEAAQLIANMQVKAVGIDAVSIDHDPFPAHRVLLSKEIGIYENLTNLDQLLGKDFIFVGVPLSLINGTASPVRAMAFVYG